MPASPVPRTPSCRLQCITGSIAIFLTSTAGLASALLEGWEPADCIVAPPVVSPELERQSPTGSALGALPRSLEQHPAALQSLCQELVAVVASVL